MNQTDDLRQRVSDLQYEVSQLEQAEKLVSDALPRARQALEAARGNLARACREDRDQRKAARQRELDDLRSQIEEAKNA